MSGSLSGRSPAGRSLVRGTRDVKLYPANDSPEELWAPPQIPLDNLPDAAVDSFPMGRPQTNYSLRKTFNYFNRGWFGNKLPKIPITFARLEGETMGEYDCDDQAIRVSNKLKNWPRTTALVVLHECVHVKHHLLDKRSPSKLNHLKCFQRDMLWLAKHGAMMKLW